MLLHHILRLKGVLCGLVTGLVLSFCVAGAQPSQMEAALASLRTARQALMQANSNRSSHRAAAIKLVDEAISEVQAGIAAAGK